MVRRRGQAIKRPRSFSSDGRADAKTQCVWVSPSATRYTKLRPAAWGAKMKRLWGWLCQVPWGVWLFLAMTQSLTLIDRSFRIPGWAKHVTDMPDHALTANLKQGFTEYVHQMEFERTVALFLTPLFLALMVMKLR